MAVEESLAGRVFAPTAAYDVTAERVAAFAAACQTPWRDGQPAPATFPIVVAFDAMRALMTDASVGIELQHVVHGEQRFEHVRPVVVGDQLTAELTVESLRSIGGADIIGTRSAIRDADGELVCTARATLVHRSTP